MRYETEKIEFKRLLTDEIYKEVIAFANTDGGTIYVGINDEGERVGLEDVDDNFTRITNGIRDAILPDVTIFIKYTLEDGKVIRIEVGEGGFKPYYLKSKGLKPSGVYVRQGTSSVPATPEQIRRMIKTADNDIFEDMRSLIQDLTFLSAEETFARHGVEFSTDKYYTLGIRERDSEQYTNLGLLLSEQCSHTVKAAVFADAEKTVFRDRKEFAGGLFIQLEETFAYLQLCNQNRSVIDGLERSDYWDYPKAAMREALLNALIHREYSFSGSTIINVTETEMEFISMGGLVAGLTDADIRSGISQPRNRKLAAVFHRLNFIEAYGTGIRRIYSLYEGCAVQPVIEVTPNTFKLTLPNMNAAAKGAVKHSTQMGTITPQMQKVLDYLREHKDMTEMELQKLLGIKRTRAYTLAKDMAAAGLIQIVGRGKERKYIGFFQP